jgi:hypothetical protein
VLSTDASIGDFSFWLAPQCGAIKSMTAARMTQALRM